MSEAIALRVPKLSRFPRVAEPCSVAIPLPEGVLQDGTTAAVFDKSIAVPAQCRCTATWPDGSVKWLLAHFLADLPGNAGKTFECRPGATGPLPEQPVRVHPVSGRCRIETGPLRIDLTRVGQMGLLHRVRWHGSELVSPGEYTGPTIASGASGNANATPASDWRVLEPGPVRAVVETHGKHRSENGTDLLDFTARIYAHAGKPWIEMAYQIMHREDEDEICLDRMIIRYHRPTGKDTAIRTALATSNYRSRIRVSESGERLHHLIDAEQLLYEANEQVPETFYGTFWADRCNPDEGGMCVTVHQAQQNFPTSLEARKDGLVIGLFPGNETGLRLIQGMAKTQRMLLHFHGSETSPEDLNIRSLQYQMPDRPTLTETVYRNAKILPDIHVERPVQEAEQYLVHLADTRTRAYGMLHWGDAPDEGYTFQGRGRGEPVWTNNEYDLPHAALMMYARTGERRMLDYLLVAAEHWMDIDVCHYCDDPMRHRGQVVHSARHVTGGVTVSHEWVEGLLDYYHQTGEHFAFETALGIGENVLRHLQEPRLRTPGGAAARETGWALRSLVALYRETHERRWLEHADLIVDQFEAWQREFGAWLAPYTDHTMARVPFMIAVAANSLMCYYAVTPQKRVGAMVVAAMDDLIENALMHDRLFYYKELPSLQRRSAGTLVLEALAHAFDLTGDEKYLQAGMPTYRLTLAQSISSGKATGPKYVAGDAVMVPNGPGPKAFAAGFYPMMTFYRAAANAGVL